MTNLIARNETIILNVRRSILLAGTALLLAAGATGQVRADWGIDPAKVKLQPSRVAGDVWVIAGPGGNVGVLASPDGMVVVDNQFGPLANKLNAALRSISRRPVRLMVNTHWHGDHVGGNQALHRAGAISVAHANVRRRMASDQVMPAFGGAKFPASPAAALPRLTFDQQITFWLGEEEVRIIHVPGGHTDGDSIVHFPRANVLHAGDIFFHGDYPIIDVGNGGSVDGLIAAQQRLLAIVDDRTRIIPGHGPVTDRAGLKAANDLLIEIRGRVAALVKQGKSVSEIQKARPTADLDAEYANPIVTGDLIVSMIATSLGAK